MGPAGQAVGANPLEQLAQVVTTIKYNYKPKSGPLDQTKRFWITTITNNYKTAVRPTRGSGGGLGVTVVFR